MKKSILFKKHRASGGKFEEQDGWLLPAEFTGSFQEYTAATTSLALMHRPYIGQLLVKGSDHVDFLHRLTTNELRNLKPGQGQVTIFTNEKGRIIDRVGLLKQENEIRLLTSAGTATKLTDWINKYIFLDDVHVENISTETGLLSLFGPKATSLLDKLFSESAANLNENDFIKCTWQKTPLIIQRGSEFNIPEYNILMPKSRLVELWEEFLSVGEGFNLALMGEKAFEILRIESGWPKYNCDFNEEMNPHEAGMFSFVNFEKGCYIGQEVIARLDTYDKVQKRLIGIILQSEKLPEFQDKIVMDDRESGFITSATFSYGLNKNIALGYIKTKLAGENKAVRVISKTESLSGMITDLPFSN